jgi:hypothetical protein
LKYLRAYNFYRAILKFDDAVVAIRRNVLHDEMDCLFKNKQ